MAVILEISDNRDGYVSVIDAILSKGKKVPSRNGDTLEIRDMVIVLTNPRDSLPVGVGRKVNPGIGAVEAAQLVGGVTDPELTCTIAPNMVDFLDENPAGKRVFWGAYGPRTKDQLIAVVNKLEQDPGTRQAIVTIWDPDKDNAKRKKDYPCTIMHDFLIRDGKLHMSTVMRSNDGWWGWCYDAFQFSCVQLSVANALNIPTGEYTHHAVSMHLYERHWNAARALHAYDGTPLPPDHGFTGENWHQVAESARYTLRAARDLTARWKENDWPETSTETWYVDTMRNAIIKTKGTS